MKDIEVLLRGFAILVDSDNYAPFMVKFLNQFSNKCKTQASEHNQYLHTLFESFLNACSRLDDDTFKNKKNKRFNVALYEAVFAASCEQAFSERRVVVGTLDSERIRNLEADEEFVQASQKGTAQTKNLTTRLNRARKIVGALDVGTSPDE